MVIFTHASNDRLVMNSKNTATYWRRSDIRGLEEINIDTLILLGCNTAIKNPQDFATKAINEKEKKEYMYSIAEAFYKGSNADSIGKIIASDGSVMHGFIDGTHTMRSEGKYFYHATLEDKILHQFFENYENWKHPCFKTNNEGFKVYNSLNNYSTIGREKYFGIDALLNECDTVSCIFEKE